MFRFWNRYGCFEENKGEPTGGAPQEQDKKKDAGEPEWLPARLERERKAAVSAVLKELGFEKPEEAKKAIDDLKKRQDAEKSEVQRLSEENKTLRTSAARAQELEETIRVKASAELATLTEEQRAAVADIAGDDPAKQLRTVERLRPTWAKEPEKKSESKSDKTETKTEPKKKPEAATTATSAKAPKPSTGEEVSHVQTWERLKKENRVLAASYRLANLAAIEAEMKASGAT